MDEREARARGYIIPNRSEERGRAEERAAIVAWLRSEAVRMCLSKFTATHLELAAKYIEAGDHLSLDQLTAEAEAAVEALPPDGSTRPVEPCTGAEFVEAAQKAIEPRSDEEIQDIIEDLEGR